MKHTKGKSIISQEVDNNGKNDNGQNNRQGLDLFFKAFFEAGSQAMHILKNGSGEAAADKDETASAQEPEEDEDARETEK